MTSMQCSPALQLQAWFPATLSSLAGLPDRRLPSPLTDPDGYRIELVQWPQGHTLGHDPRRPRLNSTFPFVQPSIARGKNDHQPDSRDPKHGGLAQAIEVTLGLNDAVNQRE